MTRIVSLTCRRRASAEKPAGELPRDLDRAGLAAFVQDAEHDLIRAGFKVLADPRSDRISVAPDHQLIDESVAQVGDIGVIETHPCEVGDVSAHPGEEPERSASGLTSSGGVGVEHEYLVDD